MAEQREESELIVDINNAQQADALLRHPLLIASMKSLRELTVEKFESLGFKDTEQMQECNVRLNLIEEFESNIAVVILSGNAAFNALEDIQTFKQQQEANNER